MLEEALSSSTYSPAEAALTFISFVEVELAAGGATAEARFFKLFSMLCDRVFGVLSKKEGQMYKHEVGGWLSRHVRWERPNMSMSNTPQRQNYGIHRPQSSMASSSLVTTDPVIKLLGAEAAIKSSKDHSQQQHALSLIEAFAKEAEHRPNVRYSFPFLALPKSTQDAWIGLLETALGGTPSAETLISENSKRLLGSLFRVKPLEQIQLRNFQQNKLQQKDNRRPLQLSPRYQAPTKSPSTPSTLDKEKNSSPDIMLSMLEYYLLVFIRYPFAAPAPQPEPARSTPRGVNHYPTVRRSEPYGETVYYQLFQEYVRYYVPVSAPQGHSNGFSPLRRPSELFVRIIVELWLESQNQLAPTEKVVKALQERRGSDVSLNLNASYDLVKSKFNPPGGQITRCLHKLVVTAQSDGAILDMVRDVHGGFKGANPEILCLSPTMTILQLPFYNCVRNSFRHASIHVKNSSFYTALRDWLMWLEPWNTVHVRGRTNDPRKRIMDTVSRTTVEQTSSSVRVTYPKPNQRSSYQPHWEPYIASNLHLYTVPLAIFLRRARELDFSPSQFQSSLSTVSRVFRVFTPQVVAVIKRLLAERNQPGSKYAEIVKRHEENLGPFAPPSSVPLSLESCQNDMHNLLEEIYFQHMKKIEELDIIDRALASLEGIFGQGAYKGEEKEIQALVQKASVIVGFPKDYEVMPSSKPRSTESQAFSSDPMTSDRQKNGVFSETGRKRVFLGETKCNPADIGYFGDPMLARPQSHEIAFLIPILVKISKFLNTKLGINEKVEGFANEDSFTPHRINLRFIADYRNVVLLVFVSWIFGLFR